MKETFIKDLQVDKEVTDFFIVKALSIKTGSNQKQYMDMLLGDKEGEANGKKWDLSEKDIELAANIKEGDVVKIIASVTEWNGQKQFRVTRIRKATEDDVINMTDYIKASPESPESMYDYIMDRVEEIADDEIRGVVKTAIAEHKTKLMYYPAATKNHHAEYGGLLYHVKRMLMSGVALCDIYKNLNKDYIIAGVVLHDLQKINEIDSNEMGIASGYSFEGQMLGHIVQGIKYLSKITEKLNVSKEKAIMLEHMILSHHYEPEFGSPKKPLFPEAEVLHYLDILDARMYDMEYALKSTEVGDFSEKVWTLENRKIFKAK